MPRKRFSTEQIITKLRQAEVELSGGLRPLRWTPLSRQFSGPDKLRPSSSSV